MPAEATEDKQVLILESFFDSIIRGHKCSLFGPGYQLRDIRFFCKQNSQQLALIAHHIHLCFQARTCDESDLAPYPRLQGINNSIIQKS